MWRRSIWVVISPSIINTNPAVIGVCQHLKVSCVGVSLLITNKQIRSWFLDGSYKATNSQLSCLQSQLDSTGHLLTGTEAALEASRRIDAVLGLLEGDLYQVGWRK